MSEKIPQDHFPQGHVPQDHVPPPPRGPPFSQSMPRISNNIGGLQQIPSFISPSGPPDYRPSQLDNSQYQHQQQKSSVPKYNCESLVFAPRASNTKADSASGCDAMENPPPAKSGANELHRGASGHTSPGPTTTSTTPRVAEKS